MVLTKPRWSQLEPPRFFANISRRVAIPDSGREGIGSTDASGGRTVRSRLRAPDRTRPCHQELSGAGRETAGFAEGSGLRSLPRNSIQARPCVVARREAAVSDTVLPSRILL